MRENGILKQIKKKDVVFKYGKMGQGMMDFGKMGKLKDKVG